MVSASEPRRFNIRPGHAAIKMPDRCTTLQLVLIVPPCAESTPRATALSALPISTRFWNHDTRTSVPRTFVPLVSSRRSLSLSFSFLAWAWTRHVFPRVRRLLRLEIRGWSPRRRTETDARLAAEVEEIADC